MMQNSAMEQDRELQLDHRPRVRQSAWDCAEREFRKISCQTDREKLTLEMLDDVLDSKPSPTTDQRWAWRRCCAAGHLPSRRFANDDLEQLYQRYFLNFHKGSLQAAIGYLILLSLALLALHYVADAGQLLPGLLLLGITLLLAATLLALSLRSAKSRLLRSATLLAFLAGLLMELVVVALFRPVTAPSGGLWTVALLVFVVYTLLPLQLSASVGAAIAMCLLGLTVKMLVLGRRSDDCWSEVCNNLFLLTV